MGNDFFRTFAVTNNKLTMNSIKFSKTDIEVSVSVYVFKENDVYIAYCPSLDLSGYDLTEEAARKDFEYLLDEYMRHQMQNNTLQQDLVRHGWKVGIRKAKEPAVKDLLRRSTQLRNLFAQPEYQKIRVNAACPVFA